MNNWSCLPAAFAFTMGTTLECMIDLIGHDGSSIIWPQDPSPLDRRGFHIQEILNAVYMLGYSAMPVAPTSMLSNGHGPATQIKDELYAKAKHDRAVHLGLSDTGINHAVAYIPLAGFWCPNRGYIAKFNTHEIWLVNKCS